MLRKTGLEGRTQLSLVSLEELVPEDHLVRKIEQAIDFSFIGESQRQQEQICHVDDPGAGQRLPKAAGGGD